MNNAFGSNAFGAQLMAACDSGDLAEARRLVAAGAPVDFVSGETPLVKAALKGHLEIARFLLDAGADINIRKDTGSTALMCAAFFGHAEVVRLLLEKGADKALRNRQGKSAEDYARDRNETGVLALLRETPDEVSFVYPLDNRVLQEIYDFRLKERLTLLRKEEGGAVEALLRDSFDKLEDVSNLRRAFEIHRRRGGKLEESEVFGSQVFKPRLMPKPR